MADEWYCQINERVFGPFTGRSLKHFASAGKLRPSNLVRNGVDGPWTEAGKVRGLFDGCIQSDPNGPPHAAGSAGSAPAQLGTPLSTAATAPEDTAAKRGRLLPIGFALLVLALVVAVAACFEGLTSQSSEPWNGITELSGENDVGNGKTQPQSGSVSAELAALDLRSMFEGTEASADVDSAALGPPPPPQRATNDLSPEEVFAQASAAVVRITTKNEEGKVLGHGSGFIIDPAELTLSEEHSANARLMERVLGQEEGSTFRAVYICTNYHVIESALDADVELRSGEVSVKCYALAQDPEADIAILITYFEAATETASLALSETLPKVGASVLAIGSPRGLDQTLTQGIVSSVRSKADGTTWLQMTTPISPGSSGGPLLSLSGSVVGLTTETLANGQNLNFAISCIDLRRLLAGPYQQQSLKLGKSYRLEEEVAYFNVHVARSKAGRGKDESLDVSTAEDAIWKALDLIAKGEYLESILLLKKARNREEDEFSYLLEYTLGVAYGSLVESEWQDEIRKLPSGKYEDAVSIMNAAHQRAPHFADAISSLQSAAKLKSSFAPAYLRLVHSHSRAGQWSEALAAANRLIALLPLCSEAYYRRAQCHEALDNLELAAADYKMATALNPRSAESYLRLGQLLSTGLLLHEEAIHCCQRAIEEGASSVFICYSTIAHAHAGLGNYDKAEQYLKLALENGLPKKFYEDSLKSIRDKRKVN